MKADKAIRFLKTIEPVGITHFDNELIDPSLATPDNSYSKGWSVTTTQSTTSYSLMVCEYSDTIDIAGLAANDISLINSGGAVGRPSSPYTVIPSNCSISQMTIVSVNPIELNANDLVLANSLDREGNLQDYFLATSQEFVKAADSVYFFSKSGEHNFGTGGIAQATKLYVKSFVISFAQRPLGVVNESVYVSPCTVALAGVTAELDPVQMAAAIYRANDQE